MEVQKTALYNYHKNLGAKFVPFAGYEMPIQYKDGIVKEHISCLLYTSPSPRDGLLSRMPSSA